MLSTARRAQRHCAQNSQVWQIWSSARYAPELLQDMMKVCQSACLVPSLRANCCTCRPSTHPCLSRKVCFSLPCVRNMFNAFTGGSCLKSCQRSKRCVWFGVLKFAEHFQRRQVDMQKPRNRNNDSPRRPISPIRTLDVRSAFFSSELCIRILCARKKYCFCVAGCSA